MENLDNYRIFLLNESSSDFFDKRRMSRKYSDRNKARGLSGNPTILKKVYSFFDRMEDRINRMAEQGKMYQQQRRSERGGNFNTGVETLFGAASVVPNVLKRVFGPNEFDKRMLSDESVDLDTLRHTNERFVKNELSKIKTEKQFEDNIEDLYRRGSVKFGQSPVLDEITRNRAASFYQREMNPNTPIIQ